MLTREEFAVGLAKVYDIWPDKVLNDHSQQSYYELLAHLPFEVYRGAIKAVLSTKSYGFPKPGDINDAAVEVVMEQYGYVSETWAREALDGWKREAQAQLAAPQGRRLIAAGEG